MSVTLHLQSPCRFSWAFNDSVRISLENIKRNYRRGRTLLRWVNAATWLLGASSLPGLAFGAGMVTAIVISVPVRVNALIVVGATPWS